MIPIVQGKTSIIQKIKNIHRILQLLVKPLKKIKIRNVNNRSVIRTLTVLKPSPVNSLVLKITVILLVLVVIKQ